MELVRVSAIMSPVMVTMRAVNFMYAGIVIIWGFRGKKFRVIISPAIMLPHARRSIDAVIAGLLSLIGAREVNRGVPISTKYTTRRL